MSSSSSISTPPPTAKKPRRLPHCHGCGMPMRGHVKAHCAASRCNSREPDSPSPAPAHRSAIVNGLVTPQPSPGPVNWMEIPYSRYTGATVIHGDEEIKPLYLDHDRSQLDTPLATNIGEDSDDTEITSLASGTIAGVPTSRSSLAHTDGLALGRPIISIYLGDQLSDEQLKLAEDRGLSIVPTSFGDFRLSSNNLLIMGEYAGEAVALARQLRRGGQVMPGTLMDSEDSLTQSSEMPVGGGTDITFWQLIVHGVATALAVVWFLSFLDVAEA